MKTKIKMILFLILMSGVFSNAYADTKEITYTNHKGLVTLRCSDYPTYSEIKLTVNGLSKTIPCNLNPPKGVVSYSGTGWTNKDVTVTVQCSDSVSGCEKESYTKKVKENGTGYIQIKNNTGNISDIAYTVNNIDKRIPSLLGVVCSGLDNNGNSESTVTCSASLSDIGPSADTLSYTQKTLDGVLPKSGKGLNQMYIYTNNGTYTVGVTGNDEAGNSIIGLSKKFKIDTSNPSINIDTDINKWYNNKNIETLKFTIKDQKKSTGDDEETGLESIIGTLNNKEIGIVGFKKTDGIEAIQVSIAKETMKKYLLEGDDNTLSLVVEDKVGNTVKAVYALQFDSEVPNVGLEIKGGKQDSFQQKYSLVLSSKDTTSGILYSKYILNQSGKCVEKGIPFDNGETLTLYDNGINKIYLCNGDHSDNVTVEGFDDFKIDNISPEYRVSYIKSGTRDNSVDVVVECIDTLSGCLKETYTKNIKNNSKGVIVISDKAGNTTDVPYKVTDIDLTPPKGIISYLPSTWTNGTVMVSIRCDDDSGCEKDIYEKKINTNSTGTIVLVDKVGNKGDVNYNVKNIDTIAPKIEFECTNEGLLNDSSVQCSAKLVENINTAPEQLVYIHSTKDGVVSGSGRTLEQAGEIMYSYTDNGIYTIEVSASDKAGNISETQTKTFKIDTSKPSINIITDINTWFSNKSLGKISFTLKDQVSTTNENEETGLASVVAELNGRTVSVTGFNPTSGVASVDIEISKDTLLKYLTNSGKNTLKMIVTDKVGHVATANYFIQYDDVVPTLGIETDVTLGESFEKEYRVELFSNDQTSKIQYSKYILNTPGKCASEGTLFQDGEEILIRVNGAQKLYVCNSDNAGNTYVESFDGFKIDNIKPKADISYSPDTWTNTDVVVNIECKDGYSGCIQDTYTKTLSTNGSGAIIISDIAKNEEVVVYNVTNIDKISPKGTVTYIPNTWTNGSVTVSVECSDNASGCEQRLYEKVITSNQTGIIIITDKAGNTEEIEYTVDKIDKESPTVTLDCTGFEEGELAKSSVQCVGAFEGIHTGSPEKLIYKHTTEDGALPSIGGEVNSGNFSQTYTNNGTYSISVNARDEAGNTSSEIVKDFKIDTSEPSANPVTDISDWFNESSLGSIGKIEVKVKDQTSTTLNEETGIVSMSATFNGDSIDVNGFTPTTGVAEKIVFINTEDLLENIEEKDDNTLIFTITDIVGNVASISYEIKYDNTQSTIDAVGNETDWSNTEHEVVLTVNDAISGIKYSKYLLNKTTSQDCILDGESFNHGESISIDTEGLNTVTLCVEDNAGNIVEKEYGEYKIDLTDPVVGATAPSIDWKNANITISLEGTDTLSGIDQSKYIWDNSLANKCTILGADFTNGDDIILSTEGEHTLYICVKDIAGNFVHQSYGDYKLDKTNPNASVILTDKNLAGDDNFTFSIRGFDNIGGSSSDESYNSHRVEYEYVISAGSAIFTGSGTSDVGDPIEGTHTFKDAIDTAGDTYSLEVTLTDKAGNTIKDTEEFKIYPNNADSTKTELTVSSNDDKYANNSDEYMYSVVFKDVYGNIIFDKDPTYFNQEDILVTGFIPELTTENGSDAIKEDLKGNELGVVTYGVSSLMPGDYSNHFKAIFPTWDNSYVNTLSQDMNVQASGENTFLKPLSLELLVSNDLSDYTSKPNIGNRQAYKLNLTNSGGLNTLPATQISDGSLLNVVTSNVILENNEHSWTGGLVNISSNFQLGAEMASFEGRIESMSTAAILEAPEVKASGIGVRYKIGGKYVVYGMNDAEIMGCAVSTLGVKITGILQGAGKADETGQVSNFSDLSKSELRLPINRSFVSLVKSMSRSNTNVVNGIMYTQRGDIKYSDVKTYLTEGDTVVLDSGNFIIDVDIEDNIGIVVLGSGYQLDTDYDVTSNIYVLSNVAEIKALIYAEGTLRSADENGVSYPDSAISTKLKIVGSLFTRNTIGGAVAAGSDYILPSGSTTTDQVLAEKYDLNYLRKANNASCSLDPEENYSTHIIYNPDNQLNPPSGFENILK